MKRLNELEFKHKPIKRKPNRPLRRKSATLMVIKMLMMRRSKSKSTPNNSSINIKTISIKRGLTSK